jgi:hypothetical protein
MAPTPGPSTPPPPSLPMPRSRTRMTTGTVTTTVVWRVQYVLALKNDTTILRATFFRVDYVPFFNASTLKSHVTQKYYFLMSIFFKHMPFYHFFWRKLTIIALYIVLHLLQYYCVDVVRIPANLRLGVPMLRAGVAVLCEC